MSHDASRRGVLHSPWGPFLWGLLFLAVFMAAYFLQKPSALVINNSTIKKIFDTYAVAVGPVVAFLWMLGMYIVAGAKRIVGLRRFRILNPIVVLVVMLPSLVFGWELTQEKPYTDIARGIIGTVASPLLIASLVTSVLAALWLVLLLVHRRPSR